MITPSDKEKIEIINCLKELDCCSRCILRYIGVRTSRGGNSVAYDDPEKYIDFICEDVKPDSSANSAPKKIRRNPCRTCLNVLDYATVEKLVDDVSINIEPYKYADYTTNVSFPKTLIIRNHSILIYLKEKFPQFYESFDIEHMAKIFRVASLAILAKKINKYFDHRSSLILVFEIGYEDDEVEIENIKKINHVQIDDRQGISRNVIMAALEKCGDKLFKELFPVPPEIPNRVPSAKIQCLTEPVWIGGRYLKFSRNMSQTPWNIENKPIVQDSLQDIIYDAIVKILGYSKDQFTFCASGREDADVRMLGNGRPFYIQIDNARDRCISFEQLRAIEAEILKSRTMAVIKLKVVYKNDLSRIKDGEEHKRKHYHALCQTDAINMDDVVRIINEYVAPLEILQKTPLRVLHRRSNAVRKKCIYRMSAKTVPDHPNLFELTLVTQAGTYVKEFGNGDMQRTVPSLCSILQQQVDVLALDVIEVELNWPEDDTSNPA